METQKLITALSLLLLVSSPALAQQGSPRTNGNETLLAQATPAPTEAPTAPAAPAAETEADDEGGDEVAGEIGPAPSFVGSATAGYRNTDLERDSFKFNEFRDMDSGILLGTEGMYFRPSGYYGYFAADALAQKDRAAEYRGGQWGGSKFHLYGNTVIHEYTEFYDRSFYTSGVGTGTVTYDPTDYGLSDPTSLANATAGTFTTPLDPLSWREAEYQKAQDAFGGSYTYKSAEHPWYASLSAEYRKIRGLQPWFVNNGVIPTIGGTSASNVVELPAPLDAKSTTVGAEAGYTTQEYTVALAAQMNDFKTDYDTLTFRDPFVTFRNGGPPHAFDQTTALTPDSKSTIIGVKAVAKSLPIDSTLALNVSRQMLRNELNILSPVGVRTAAGAYSYNNTLLSSPTFNGKIDYDNASLIWNAQVTDKLSLSAAGRYTNKKNESDVITFNQEDGAGTAEQNHLIGYEKQSYSASLGYKLPADTKASLYLSQGQTLRRGTLRVPKNKDRSAELSLRNASLDTLGVALKLAYGDRELDYTPLDTDSARIQNFRPYYVASNTRKAATLTLDYSPIDNLMTTAEYTYAIVDYRDIPYGLKKDARDEYYVDLSYELPTWFKVTGFYSFASTRNDGTWYRGTVGTVNATNYAWDLNVKADNYYYGGKIEVPVVEDQVDVQVGYVRMKDDGLAAFEPSNPAVTTPDVDEHFDSVKDELSAKVTYRPIERLETSVAYAHQRLTTDDLRWRQFDTVSETNRIISSGAGKDFSYDANLIYASATYSF